MFDDERLSESPDLARGDPGDVDFSSGWVRRFRAVGMRKGVPRIEENLGVQPSTRIAGCLVGLLAETLRINRRHTYYVHSSTFLGTLIHAMC
jgi:hypothetical protein